MLLTARWCLQDGDEWITPHPRRHRRDNSRRSPKGSPTTRRSGHHSSGSSSTQPRHSSLSRSAPPSAVARQVTPHLADASARILGINNDSDSDDPSQPLSSTSARSLAAATAAKQQAADRTVVAQQAPVDIDAQIRTEASRAASSRREAGRVAAIKRAYLQMDVKKLWHIKTMPAAENEDSGQFTSALISSMRRTMRNICDEITP